jgi:hypothetical protein
MNAPVGNFEPAASVSAIDQVHIWRSKFLDYSARCETRLRLLHHLQSPSNEAFLQIKSLALAVKAAKQNSTKLAEAIDELLPLIELRAELAHSAVTLLNVNTQQTAVFVNAANKAPFGRNALMLDQDDRDNALKKIKKVAEHLKLCQKVVELAIKPTNQPR